jgi:hypothetical protein
MDLLHTLPFLSTVVTLIFAAMVFNRYLKGRRWYTLIWSLGLVLYAAGTFAEAYLALRWSGFFLRVWYLSGAMLTAAWLGQGTIYLLVRKQGVAHGFALGLLAVSLLAVGLVFTVPLKADLFQKGVALSTQYKDLMPHRPGLMILLTILLNIYGTITLIGGAAYSAWLFWRKQVLSNRMWGNILIAAGALFPAGAGTLIRLGLADWLYVSELFGAVLMFAGFWLATQPQPAEQATSAAVPAA